MLERGFLGEPFLLVGVAELRAPHLHQVFGVGLIHDGKSCGDPALRAKTAQQAVRRAMKRSAVHGATPASDEPFNAGQHFVRGPSRERQEQNPLRTRAGIEQFRHPMNQSARLACSRAGNDEQRAATVGRGALLRVIQAEHIGLRARLDFAVAGRVYSGRSGHTGNIPKR